MVKTATLLKGTDGSIIRRSVLDNGVRVITEKVPGVSSASIGMWIDAGSRDESASHTGAAHYLEHLLFKGTTRRSAMDISSSIEAVGGDINAFTSKEHTCYYARVLADDLPLAIDVLTDVVTDALLLTGDIEAERGVILEEIAMVDDDPSDLVHDQFALALFGNTPLGRPILGTADTIKSISRRAIVGFYRKHYRPENLVVAIAGNVDHSKAVRQLSRVLRSGFKNQRESRQPIRSRNLRGKTKPRSLASDTLDSRVTEQAHLVMGNHGLARGDSRRFASAVLSTLLGGGMSSRLFQSVREQRGLAYSVYAYSQGFRDAGLFGIYAGCIPTKLDQVLEVCETEIDLILNSGFTDQELSRGKGQVKGGTVLGQEDPSARMSRIAKSELFNEELLSVAEVLRAVDQVSIDDVHALAHQLFSETQTISVIGPFDRIPQRRGNSPLGAVRA